MTCNSPRSHKFPAPLRYNTPSVSHQVHSNRLFDHKRDQQRDPKTNSLYFKSTRETQEGVASQFHSGTLVAYIVISLPRGCPSRTGSKRFPKLLTPYIVRCCFLSLILSGCSSLSLGWPSPNLRAPLRYSTMPPRYERLVRPQLDTSVAIRLVPSANCIPLSRFPPPMAMHQAAMEDTGAYPRTLRRSNTHRLALIYRKHALRLLEDTLASFAGFCTRSHATVAEFFSVPKPVRTFLS